MSGSYIEDNNHSNHRPWVYGEMPPPLKPTLFSFPLGASVIL